MWPFRRKKKFARMPGPPWTPPALTEDELKSLERCFGPGGMVQMCSIDHPCEAAKAAVVFLGPILPEVRAGRQKLVGNGEVI